MVICKRIILCCVFYCLCYVLNPEYTVEGRKGVGDTEQKWGYVTVRPHAHMFWWLYYTTANVRSYTKRPLIIWLQGGPGMPSSCYGNFVEIGPLDIKLNKRKHSWVKHFNVLFVDNPVGVGFSYISNNITSLVENNHEIGRDLIAFIKSFLKENEEFQKVDLYIFGESYGGKMAVEFAYQLNEEVEAGNITANLKGIGLGDAYISPIDYINNYASLARTWGFIDNHGFIKIEYLAKQIQIEIEEEKFEEAYDTESKITDAVVEATQGIDIYNIMLKTNISSLPRFLSHQGSCNSYMNTILKSVLDIPKEVEWTFINDDVYSSLQMDLMKSVTKTIENLLNSTNIKVIVYNGVLDFIVNTAGTANWLDNLNWKGKSEWHNKTQGPLQVNMINEGYVRRVGNLVFYTVLRAGHSVPEDNPVAMKEILRRELLVN